MQNGIEPFFNGLLSSVDWAPGGLRSRIQYILQPLICAIYGRCKLMNFIK